MSRSGHRGNGWAALDYSNKHNKIPQIQPPTRWDCVLAELQLTEEKALKVIKKPLTKEEKKQRNDLERKLRGKRDRYFIPLAAIDAFGWREQQEQKFAC